MTVIAETEVKHKTTSIQTIFEQQKEYQYIVSKSTANQRIAKLKHLYKTVIKYRSQIIEALHQDFGKPSVEVDMVDIYPITSEIKHAVAELKNWMRVKPVPTPLAFKGSKSYIQYEPKGVVLIISPWNFPFNLTFSPLVSAIAAGNCVILKPSEFTPHSSAVMQQIIHEVFERKEVALFEGDVSVSQELLKLPFNHIFFTGSPRVGKIVMKAAADHLASVTLELGGKSPTIVAEGANLDEAATKIAWGKFANAGQVCIAPDYVFVHSSDKGRFLDIITKKLNEFYGETAAARQASSSFARIINKSHFSRLKHLFDDAVLKGAKVVSGGHFEISENYISPTVITNIDTTSAIMKEEIFGPILPVLVYDEIEEPIEFIKSKEKPLALYLFSRNKRTINKVMSETRAGGGCINDCGTHFFNPNLPFGGSNNSGIGKSHGVYGFEAFSNIRGVLKQPTLFSGLQLMLPPYTDTIKKLTEMTVKWL